MNEVKFKIEKVSSRKKKICMTIGILIMVVVIGFLILNQMKTNKKIDDISQIINGWNSQFISE